MKRIIILCLTSILSITAFAQSRQNLSQLLDRLTHTYDVVISYSSTLTDKTFPYNTDISGDLTVALERILDGTEFGYRIVGGKYYQIYKKPHSRVLKKEPIKKVEPPQDTTRFHQVTMKIAGIGAIPSLIDNSFSMPTTKPTIPTVSQQAPQTVYLPKLAIKSNLLYDATSTINLGFEIGLGKHTTLDISGNYNPWTFSDNHKMKHLLIQPEFRIWTCSRFSGGFWGIHAHYGVFNWGGMLPWGFNSGKMFGVVESQPLMNHRYEGWLVGAGVSYGYHWILGKRWGLEAEIGAGYAYLEYDKFRCEKCGVKVGRESQHYFGPTKASVTLVFMIK